MRKRLTVLAVLAMLAGLAVPVSAAPIYIDVSGSQSSVEVSDVSTLGWTSLAASLVGGLGSQTRWLADGASWTFEFFTLTASGLGVGSATIGATLGFDAPAGMVASGLGDSSWGTIFGHVSGGILTWDPATLPELITVGDTLLRISFQDGVALGLGDTATVHATVSNLGTAQVPEPFSMALLGVGLFGLGAAVRRRR